MQLKYRGVTYEYNPPTVEATEEVAIGKYRGLDWRFRNLKAAPVIMPTHNLKYRGVAYSTGPVASSETASNETASSETANTVKPKVTVSELARYRMASQSRAIEQREQSMLNRLAAQVGVDTSEWKFSNHIQGKIHPSFRLNYERTGPAFS